MVGDEAEIDRVGPESVAQQARLGRGYGIRCPLVDGQRSNEGQNLRDIRLGRRSDRCCHSSILECDTGHTQRPPRRTTIVR